MKGDLELLHLTTNTKVHIIRISMGDKHPGSGVPSMVIFDAKTDLAVARLDDRLWGSKNRRSVT